MTLPDRPFARVLRAAEADAWQDGFAFLAQARADARAIRDTATEEVATAREQGRIEGRTQGEIEAAKLLLDTQAEITSYLGKLEPQLIDLTFQILSEVLDGASDADLITRAARRALAAFSEAGMIALSVPEAHLAEVGAALSGLGLRVEADRHLTGRQCILTSPATSIDISIDAQLQAIRNAMAER